MIFVQRTTVLVLACIATSTLAQTRYECSSGNVVRRVEIMYDGDGAVPCAVQYVKETEAPGIRVTLWDAQNEAGYCEARAQELVTRLESLGWSCDAGDTSAAPDDSGVLAPEDAQE